jgi:CRISPR-associated protein Cas1
MSASHAIRFPNGPISGPDAEGTPRKPPQAEQYNWIRERYEAPPEQLSLDLPSPPEIDPAYEDKVSMLATENGTQLLIAGFGLSVGKQSERIVVKQARKVVAQLPLLRLQEVVIGSRGVSLSSDIIEALCQRGIRMAFLSGTGRPYALLTSPLLTATVEIRKAQIRAVDGPAGAEIARWIVAGKIRNQAKLLLYFARNRQGAVEEDLRKAHQALQKLKKQALQLEGETCAAVRPSLFGYEGAAARVYWLSLVELVPDGHQFAGRNPYMPSDAVNAALNYGYGILNSHVWGAVMNAGLEPFAGLLHVDRSGKPSLVLDLMEEFRQPVVDRPIFAWLFKNGSLKLENGLLDKESKEGVAARVLARLNATEPHRGKEHQVRSIIQMQARLAAAAFRERRPYRPFSFQW